MRAFVSCGGGSLARVAAGLFFLPLALLGTVGSLEAEVVGRVPRVLILYPNDERQPATSIGGEVARARLVEGSNGKIDLFSEFLDLARFPEEDHIASMADYLAEKYARVRPDIVLAAGTQALAFIVANRSIIAPDARIVYVGASKSEAASMHLPDDVFGALTEFDLARTVGLARGLQPEARKLVVVGGSSPFDKEWLKAAEQEIADLKLPIETTVLTDLSIDEFVQRVSKLPRDTILLILTVFKDSKGQNFATREAAAQIATAATAPSYGVYSTYVGNGIVGTSTFTFESMGRSAADLVLDAIADKPISDVIVPQTYMVDARQLARWGMDRENLPPETVISFDDKSLWEQHYAAILTTFAVVAVQALIISALLLERRRRTRAEQSARSRLLEVVHLNQSATAGALSASIAHELNQPLGAIRNNTRAAQLVLKSENPDLALMGQILADIREDDQRASDIIVGLRAMLKKRSEIEWQELDVNEVMVSALQILHGEAERRRVEIDFRRPARQLPVRVDRVHLQQVIINIATNAIDAMLEARPAERKLTLKTEVAEPGQVVISIADTGTGIPTEKLTRIFETFYTTKATGTGLGLSIARTVVESYGGKIWAENRPEGGAVVSFILPMVQTS